MRVGLVRGCMKGTAGSVRGLQCHPSLPLVASCGLDRFLRIHNLQDRTLIHKVHTDTPFCLHSITFSHNTCVNDVYVCVCVCVGVSEVPAELCVALQQRSPGECISVCLSFMKPQGSV